MSGSDAPAAPPARGTGYYLWALVAFVVLATRILPPWTQKLGDPDFWWLDWFGTQWLHGAMPRTNGFSWTAPDHPWITHEPLVGLIDALAGPQNLGLLRCLLLATTWLVLAWAAWRRDGGRALPFALGWAMLLVAWGISERALSWGNLAMAVTVALTAPARHIDGRTPLLGGWPFGPGLPPWRGAAAVLAVALWANLHGSFPVGIMLVGLADWRFGLLAALATAANPHGVAIWGLLGQYAPGAGVGKFMVATAMLEWLPLPVSGGKGLMRLALLLAVLPLLWPLRWRPLLLWLALTGLALQHTRFTDLAGIGLLPWVSAGLSRRVPPQPAPSPLPAAAAFALLLALVLPPPRFDPAEYPPDLPFATLAGHRLWNQYDLGGYLGAHGVAVFWDPRVDCYPAEVLDAGTGIELHPESRLALLDKWKIDRVVASLPPLLDQLRAAGWREAARAGTVFILARPGT